MPNQNREGQTLGKYLLRKLVGKGAFAEVYIGEHTYLGKQRAIKVLDAKLIDELSTENFLKEARRLAQLEHPNIVRVIDFDVENGVPFLVMDYIPNGSLRKHYPAGTQLGLLTVISYVKQIASALQLAHNMNPPLVHRDIKPDNILLGQNNEALLSDYGIAINTSTYLQSQTDIAGTVPYMSPEQIQGKPRRASDQYSLGIVTYEWIAGERPFQGTQQEIIMQHFTVPPASLREKVPAIPSGVDQAVLKALAKNPEDRFTSVTDFTEALEKACVLPGESNYPMYASNAIREFYYQWKGAPNLGSPKEIGPDDSQLQTSLRGNVGYERPFVNGSIFWSERGGVHPVWWGFADIHHNLDGAKGMLGFPLTKELQAEPSPQGTTGVYQRFEGRWDYPEDVNTNPVRCGASLYYSDQYGPYSTWGGIGIRYERLGGTSSHLGFPKSFEQEAGPSMRGTRGMYQCFEGGDIYWSWNTESHPIWGSIRGLFLKLGSVNSRLGFPITGEETAADSPQGTKGVFQRFESSWDYSEKRFGASIYHSVKYGPYETWGGIGEYYENLGGTGSTLGFPTSSEKETDALSPQGTKGWYQHFEGGDIYWCEKFGGVSITGPIVETYRKLGSWKSRFGFPMLPQTAVEGHTNLFQQEFEGGVICIIYTPGTV